MRLTPPSFSASCLTLHVTHSWGRGVTVTHKGGAIRVRAHPLCCFLPPSLPSCLLSLLHLCCSPCASTLSPRPLPHPPPCSGEAGSINVEESGRAPTSRFNAGRRGGKDDPEGSNRGTHGVPKVKGGHSVWGRERKDGHTDRRTDGRTGRAQRTRTDIRNLRRSDGR